MEFLLLPAFVTPKIMQSSRACKDGSKVRQTAAFQDGLVMFRAAGNRSSRPKAVVSPSGALINPDKEVLKGDFFCETVANSALCNQIFWKSALVSNGRTNHHTTSCFSRRTLVTALYNARQC